MQKQHLCFLFFPFFFIQAIAQRSIEDQYISFDFSWRFHLGDQPDAFRTSFDDSRWRLLDLPHDWSVEQPFNPADTEGWQSAYLPGGKGWYRKSFFIKKKTHRHFMIRFDGVYMNSEVWVNGHYLGKRPYGYISFEYELTPYLKDGKNVIAVKVDNSKLPSGRWYTGSGIYRHVWLRETGAIYIPQWGTHITTPRITAGQATVAVSTELQNRYGAPKKVVLQTEIFDPAGKKILSASEKISLDSGRSVLLRNFTLERPQHWSPETPVRYRVIHRIIDATQQESYTTWFGIRSIRVNAKEGFVLNDKRIKLNGVCLHHDGGPVGAAVPEDVLHRRLRLLKDMGCNAIRTSHNPAAPELYTICDTLGLMVLDEAFDGWSKPKASYDYGLYFNDWWQRDLEDFIRRDRNHPAVIMWSIGNEVPAFDLNLQKQLVSFLKRLDSTRPVTQARSGEENYVDISGVNGEGEMPGVLEKYHQQHPDKPVLGTEITHTLQTRGVYAVKTSYRTRDFPAPWEKKVKWEDMKGKYFPIPDLLPTEIFTNHSKFYQSSYDNAIVRIGVRDQHNRSEQFPFFIGTFRWTGFDYLGEATIQPARTANFGILDLCGFAKDHYYLYQSLWSAKPMIHILPHWTHPGKEGVEIPVAVYTNAKSAELFLNNKSLGRKIMGIERQLVWHVPYEPGILKAVALNENEVVATTQMISAGNAVNISLLPDKKTIRANRRDVVHVEINITDKKGTLVPDADHLLSFALSGPGKIIGVENGDITDFSSMKAHYRKAFKGKCLVMIQATSNTGTIYLRANTDFASSGISIIAAP